jgi:hypothetical protein
MAKKDSVDVVDSVDSEEEEYVAEAKSTTGKTPHDILVLTREFSKMLQAVKMSRVGRMWVGTYFIPREGQIGIEGLVNAASGLMNNMVQDGWQPWGMGAPYASTHAFIDPTTGMRTGNVEGQWLTIIWTMPAEELQ